ncbi:glutamate receptor U1-like isoform X2 [Ambystoma mexicanum]
MDRALGFVFCVISLLLLGEPGHVGAEEKRGVGDEADKTTAPRAQQTLTVTTILQAPFATEKGSELEGYCVELMTDLARKLGFGFRLAVVKDGKYGALDIAGNWSGMIGEIIRKEADLAMAPLTVTSAREQVVDFTKPFMQTGISILLKKDTGAEASFLFRFLRPFSAETWIGLLVAYLVTCFCLFIVARLSPCEWREPPNEENKFTFLNSLWFGAGALTLQGVEPHPKSLSARIIAVIWWVFTIILVTAYIASFAALLNSGNEQAPTSIQSFDDLVKQRAIEFGTIEGSSTYNFFKTSKNPTYRMIYDYMERRRDYVMVKSVADGVQRAKESNYAFIGESVMQDIVVAKDCNLVRVPEVVGARGYGIAAALDSPLTKTLSIAILQMSESGHLDFLRDKWWGGSCSKESSSGYSPLQPQTLGGVFLILAIGLALGVIVALLELTFKARNTAEEQKKPCCSAFTEEIGRRFRSQEEEHPENPEKIQP